MADQTAISELQRVGIAIPPLLKSSRSCRTAAPPAAFICLFDATIRLACYWPVPVRGLIRKFLQSQMTDFAVRAAQLGFSSAAAVRRSVFRG